MVLFRGPWSFDNRLVVMVKLKKGDPPGMVFRRVFTYCFLGHVADVPFQWYTKAMGHSLGQVVGSAQEVDCEGAFLRL